MIEFYKHYKKRLKIFKLNIAKVKFLNFNNFYWTYFKKEAEITNSDNLYKEADDCLYEAKIRKK